MKRLVPFLVALAIIMVFEPSAMAAGDVPWRKIGFHAINFAILVGLLFFLLKTPVGNALKSRATQIRRDVEEVDRLKQEAQARFDEIDKKIESFDAQLTSMKDEAEEQAKAEAEEISQRAQRDADLVIQAAERTIRDETARARQALRADAVKLAVDIAEENLKKEIKATDNERFATDFLDKVENSNGVGHG